MKAVIVGPAFPLRGGIADFNEALAIAFQEEKIETSIYSFYFQYPKFLFPGTNQNAEGSPNSALKIHSTISSVNPISWWNTAKKIISEKPDFVVIRYWLPFMAPALGTIAKLLRRKKIHVIAITDNVIPHEKRPGDSAFTGYFVRNCDAFVTMSKSVLNDLSKFTSSAKKKFIPHPVYNIFGQAIPKSEARKKLSIQNDEKLILFFGFIRSYKGLDLLIEAMSDPALRDLNVKLLIAGEFYEDRKPYLDKIASIENGDRFILHTEFIGKESVKNYFCAADLIVQPYKSATQSGITQIAYHFGRPMLVTNVGGLAEIVTDKRVGYVTERTAGAIADAISDFYVNHRENDFAKNVLADREKFSWKNFTNTIIELNGEIDS
ncbi:MAG: glycosyltransferase [Bacteroidetes bacterium]|nr:glycosyltransferase [Bacteroidota bacterium]MBK8584000.1 glycosyltransferase [Bacteroidota bacterium]